MLRNPFYELYSICQKVYINIRKIYLPGLAMYWFAPLSCLMQFVEKIFQRFLKFVVGYFVSTVLTCVSCFCKYSFSRNPNLQQMNAITKQLCQHLHCSIRSMGCSSKLMKSAVLCVNLKQDHEVLRRYSQSYTYFYECSRNEINYSLQSMFQQRLRNFRWLRITGESRNTLCSIK